MTNVDVTFPVLMDIPPNHLSISGHSLTDVLRGIEVRKLYENCTQKVIR
jgi:hypothetical protein